MNPRKDICHESHMFRGSELMWRDSKFSHVINLSILTVGIGILNVVLFSRITPIQGRRDVLNCDALNLVSLSDSNTFLWASTGIFAILVFVVAPIGKSTMNAWSCETTTFFILAPFVTIVCLAFGIGSALLGICTVSHYSPEISNGTDVIFYPQIFYCIIDFLVSLFGVILFFLLISLWTGTLEKRLRSKRNTDEEVGDESMARSQTGNMPVDTVIENAPTVVFPSMVATNIATRTTPTPILAPQAPVTTPPAPTTLSPTMPAPPFNVAPNPYYIGRQPNPIYNIPHMPYPSYYRPYGPTFSPPPIQRPDPYYPFRSGYALRRNPLSNYPMFRRPY